MDHIKVLKRAWETTWRYRALWVFGIILALTTGGSRGNGGGGSGGGGGGNGGNGTFTPPGNFPWPNWRYTWGEIPPHVLNALIIGSISVICVIVFLIVVGTIARYVAETALIRMVDDQEETGEQRSVRQGFRMGWSRTTFRLFLINLLIGLPATVTFILLFVLAFAPLLLWATGNRFAGVIGTVVTVGLFFLILFLAIVVGALIALLMRFFWRACALEELGVLDSIREGFGVVRRHVKDVVIMWLIMIGVRIGWAILLVVTFIVLFPVMLLVIVVGAVLGGAPALLVGGLASLLFEGALPWVVGIVIGFPIFILIVAAPWVFLGGLMEVFKSSTWTLTYRELRILEELEPEMELEPKDAEWNEADADPLADSL